MKLVHKDWPRASWNSSREPSDSECNMLSRCNTLPESVLETTDYRLASIVLRNHRSFLLILNTFYKLYQCYYSNSEQVNVCWELFP